MRLLRDGLLEGRVIRLTSGAPAPLREQLSRLGARLDGDGADALVFDATDTFGAGGRGGLEATLDAVWAAISEVALVERGTGGKIVLISAASPDIEFAGALADALENLARTLSVEWARFGVRTTMIARGAGASEDELAELVCFLLSEAGDYFTGCRLDVGALARAPT